MQHDTLIPEAHIDLLHSPVTAVLATDRDHLVLAAGNDWEDAAIYLYDDRNDSLILLAIPGGIIPSAIRMKAWDNKVFLLSGNGRLCSVSLSPSSRERTYSPVLTGIIAGQDTLLNAMPYDMARSMIRERLDNIPFKNHDLTLIYSTTDFIPGMKKHQFQIGDVHPGGRAGDSGNVLRLTGLKEGNFRLKTRFINSSGVLSAPADIRFTIKPPVLPGMVCLDHLFGSRIHRPVHLL